MKSIEKILVLICLISCIILSVSSCEDEDTVTNQDINSSESNSVYVYNLNGIAEYRYDSNSRVVEVVNLDPQTLNEFLPDGSDYICKYFYDESGAINKLIYFGKEFRIESISEENVATAICDSEANVITARLTFNDNGILVLEEFYEKDTLVLKNKFDSNGLPSGFDYAGLGKMSFNYEDKETYISVTPYGSNTQESEITITVNDHGYPQYMMQMADGAMIGTTWAYDDANRCIDTLIESSAEGYSYIEEYEIYYDSVGNLSTINYLAPNSDKEPVLSAKREYSYSPDNTVSGYTETDYTTSGAVEEKKKYNLLSNDIEDVTTESYTDGELNKIEHSITEFDVSGRKSKHNVSQFSSDNSLISRQETIYEYTVSGAVSKRTILNYNANDQLSNKLLLEYTYDTTGRVDEVLYTAYDSVNNIIEKELDEFEYDDNGNAIIKSVTMMDGNGDVLSRSVIESQYDENSEVLTSKTTVYDANGNIVTTE